MVVMDTRGGVPGFVEAGLSRVFEVAGVDVPVVVAVLPGEGTSAE